MPLSRWDHNCALAQRDSPLFPTTTPIPDLSFSLQNNNRGEQLPSLHRQCAVSPGSQPGSTVPRTQLVIDKKPTG